MKRREDNPLSILGFTHLPTLSELKKMYRKLILIHHPDAGGCAKMATKIIAAYAILVARIEKLS